MLDPDSLQVFVVAAETENFSRAARQLHMSQPAVSQHISQLEKQLGIQLFDRHGRRIRLSAKGAALLPMAREFLRTHRRLQEAASELVGEVVGQLVIGCSTTSGKYLLPRLLAWYRERYPLVRATVIVRTRSQVIEQLASGELDVAVTNEPVPRAGLRYHRFFQDEIVLVVPAEHPWAQCGEVQPQALHDERFIMREPASGTYMTVSNALRQVGVDIEDLETVLTIENSEAAALAVQEGLGLAFIPCMAAHRCVALGRVKPVRIAGTSMTRWIYLVERTTGPRSAAVSAFWRFVHEEGLPRISQSSLPICSTPIELIAS